jgi:hypothetical protein
MRRLFGSLIVLTLCGSLLPAADPTPEDAVKLLDKLKAKHLPRKAPADKIVAVDLGRKRIANDDLKTIAALRNVRELNLGGPILKEMGDKTIFEAKQINDDGLKYLAGLTELRQLQLDGTHVSDAGLKHLAGMKKLEILILSDTKVTDDGMEELTKLPKLQSVSLFNTKVTDSGVGVLKRWKSELKVNR